MTQPLDTHSFDILYGKSKDNKTKSWKISVEQYTDYSEILTLYGYNRKIETRRRVSSGKNLNKANATTHFQQAVLEATSKWTKKKDIEKYSPIKPNETLDETDTLNIDKLNINDTTNVNLICFPMLAQDFSKHKKKVIYPCFIQPKLDGYRMIYNTTSQTITTRQGKEFSIVKQSSKLYKELCSLPSGYILDGELYVHNSPDIQDTQDKVSFETLGVLRKTKNLTKEDKTNLDKIEYHVYDIIDTKLTYNNRKTMLHTLIDKKFGMIKPVTTIEVTSEDEITNYHQQIVNIDGYEGTMIRNYNGMYKEKYRSFDLLKFKDFMDSEFEIIDYTFEKDTSGADKNLIVWIIKIKENIKCKVRPKGTKEQRQEIYSQCEKDFSKFKGKKLWTKFFEYTSDGNLRFPTTKTTSIDSYLRNELI
jgi:ATP-dependent DNA ligase